MSTKFSKKFSTHHPKSVKSGRRMIKAIKVLETARMTGKLKMIIVKEGLLVPLEEVEEEATVVAKTNTKVASNPRLTTTSMTVVL